MVERAEDELAFLAGHVPFAGRSVLDIGCGDGAATRRLVENLGAARAVGLEVSKAQIRQNGIVSNPPGVTFVAGRAESLPFEDNSFHIAMMQKSFHHVPVAQMGTALNEAARVLDRDGGVLVVSEPVAAGPFDEIMRIFHDEHVERAAAQEALAACKVFARRKAMAILSPVEFPDFDTFRKKMMTAAVAGRDITDEEVDATRQAYCKWAQNGRLSLWREFSITLLSGPLPRH